MTNSLPHLLEESREEFERKIDKETAEAGECGILNIYDFFDEAAESLIKKAYALGKKDGIAHASFLVAKHDPQTGYDVSPVYWGQTLRKDLIDEEVSLAKQLKGQSITSEPSPEK